MEKKTNGILSDVRPLEWCVRDEVYYSNHGGYSIYWSHAEKRYVLFKADIEGHRSFVLLPEAKEAAFEDFLCELKEVLGL